MTDPIEVFQLRIAEGFFSLPEAEGYVLAGGGALRAHRLIERPTRDLDFFSSSADSVTAAAAAFEAYARRQRWDVEVVIATAQFVRLVVNSDQTMMVDLALDGAAQEQVEVTDYGPTLHPNDLAGRKTLALFDRAEARDFADVFVLSRMYSRDGLIELAMGIDRGFDRLVFAEMLDTLDRFEDDDIPVPQRDAAELRAFFSAWKRELTAGAS